MKVKDIMSHPVITVTPDDTLLTAVRIMLQRKISGLPVVDAAGHLVGMVTEGDLLRRAETDTVRRRPRWIEFFVGPGRLAEEYVHGNARMVSDVMSPEVKTVGEDAPLEEVVRTMERYGIKRVPVLRGTELVGMVTRKNLMHALLRAPKRAARPSATDATIREQLLAHLSEQSWAPVGAIDVQVSDGIVTLSGTLTDDRQRQALCVAAQNIPGVKKVEDRLAWVIPGTGIGGEPAIIIGPAEH
jgi:CBS domain-containing protein